MSENREELIMRISDLQFEFSHDGMFYPEKIADFIIEDRKRIVEAIEKEYESNITYSIQYLLFDTSHTGINRWIKSMKKSFNQRIESISLAGGIE
jgi:hypothetical protein